MEFSEYLPFWDKLTEARRERTASHLGTAREAIELTNIKKLNTL